MEKIGPGAACQLIFREQEMVKKCSAGIEKIQILLRFPPCQSLIIRALCVLLLNSNHC